MATKTYKLKRKISATESEEIKIPASSVDGLSTVATSGSYNDLSNKPAIPSATDTSKHSYTELTNENLNTITEVGWYRAAKGNTCTFVPTFLQMNKSPFILFVEKIADGTFVRQTIYGMENYAAAIYGKYVRIIYKTSNATSHSSWTDQYTVNEYTQTFTGRKIFNDGIGVGNSLQFGSDAGSNGQFAMSQGSSSAPKWVNLQVKVNGTTYTADSSGLIDLGTIGGGGSRTSPYNDIY